jgi:hypothetical protein
MSAESEQQPETGSTSPSRIVQIIPATPGWWMLWDIKRVEGLERRGIARTPVGGWALVDYGSHQAVQPLIGSDGGLDIPYDGFYGDFRVEVTEQMGHCVCRRSPRDPEQTDDIWWCEHCAGVISND